MERLDVALIQSGYAASRQRAKELIQQGSVTINGTVCTKAARSVSETDQLAVTDAGLQYVGRGGLKLEAALPLLGSFSLRGAVCMDIGASTGGFTDCMLQNGAQKVYAVDVGRDQLAQKLRQDARVVNLEQTDIRKLPETAVAEPIAFLSVDVSFISLRLIIPELVRFLQPGGMAILLIKPQFEAGKEGVGKHGIVRSQSIHQRVLEQVLSCLAQNGLSLQHLIPSPIRGGSGNVEYLAVVQYSTSSAQPQDLAAVVRQAFA